MAVLQVPVYAQTGWLVIVMPPVTNREYRHVQGHVTITEDVYRSLSSAVGPASRHVSNTANRTPKTTVIRHYRLHQPV